MSTQENELIREQIESTVETINGLSAEELRSVHPASIPEIEPLDVKTTVNARGDIAGPIFLVLATGGPHIEFDVTGCEVVGYWGGEASMMVSNTDVCDQLDAYYREYFNEHVLV